MQISNYLINKQIYIHKAKISLATNMILYIFAYCLIIKA